MRGIYAYNAPLPPMSISIHHGLGDFPYGPPMSLKNRDVDRSLFGFIAMLYHFTLEMRGLSSILRTTLKKKKIVAEPGVRSGLQLVYLPNKQIKM